jgi:hypothetical protein
VREGKMYVAEVTDDRVRFVPVELGYNDGKKVRVLRGLKGGETVGLNVPVQLSDGDEVQPMTEH